MIVIKSFSCSMAYSNVYTEYKCVVCEDYSASICNAGCLETF